MLLPRLDQCEERDRDLDWLENFENERAADELGALWDGWRD
ncbi:MAG: hypothetical protein ACRDNP_04280 [Gaiellaceae bacterium]